MPSKLRGAAFFYSFETFSHAEHGQTRKKNISKNGHFCSNSPIAPEGQNKNWIWLLGRPGKGGQWIDLRRLEPRISIGWGARDNFVIFRKNGQKTAFFAVIRRLLARVGSKIKSDARTYPYVDIDASNEAT